MHAGEFQGAEYVQKMAVKSALIQLAVWCNKALKPLQKIHNDVRADRDKIVRHAALCNTASGN